MELGAQTRREFLGAIGTLAGAALAMAGETGTAGPAPVVRKGDMPHRRLGRTGEQVSLIGLGGYHVSVPDEPEAIRMIQRAVDEGITFMDNSWDYREGESERRMGKALRGRRDEVFLMTKIDGRTREAAATQLDESLRRLQTDHVDLLQHHEVIRMEDPDRIFADDGAQRALLDAQAAGKVRYIGFTGHKDPAIHLRMLEVAEEHGFRFDTVQMPLNVLDAHFRSFEKNVLPVLVQRDIGVLGMKSMGDGLVLKAGVATPIECLHYAMSLPTSVVITGIDSERILEQALEAARTFAPMSQEAIAALLARTAQAARSGRWELFKTSDPFDSTAHNPAWLG